MAYKHYKYSLVVLISMVILGSVALGWALSHSRIHLSIVLGILVLVGVLFLIRLLSSAHREILFFFKALENDDTSINYRSDHRSRFIDELHNYLNALNLSMRELKLSSEIRENYFSRILENLSSGLVVIAQTGHINHINDEALRLLGLEQLTHIKALSGLHPSLYALLLKMKAFQNEEYVWKDEVARAKKVLGLQMVEINLKGEDVKVLTIHDLSAGMERKEIDDWIRLIRVLSHEIMNSLAPITSISTTLKELWSEAEVDSAYDQDKESRIRQTLKGLDAIAEQSEGLTTFFESYRVLSRIPDPVRKEFPLCGLLEKLETLVTPDPENMWIEITFHCGNPDLHILADEQMITQVMLNLLKNGVQALKGVNTPTIVVVAKQEGGRVILSVSDNGHGIPKEISDEIFLPFFTTRSKGNGVGLSYSRQVMAMHDASIEFDSTPGRTEFRLVF